MLMIIADLTDPKNISEVTAGFVAFFVQFLPLIAVIFSLQLAGGLVGRIHQALSGQLSKAGAGIKGNPNDPNSFMNSSKRNALSTLTRRQARTVDAGRALGASRTQRIRGKVARKAWRNVDERMSRLVKEDRERADTVSATGRDDLRYAGAGWELPAGQAAPSFVQGAAAGTTTNHKRYFNSKGKEISQDLYSEGQASYGSNREAVANSLNWTARKIQTDDDIANFRHAFTQQAVKNNWNDTEQGDAWATATYEYKPQMSSEWYSRPQAVVDPTTGRTTGVRFKDIGNDDKSYHGFMSENHKTRESFKLSSMRDSEWRAMAHQQSTIQEKIDSGGEVSKLQLENYAMTNEVLDNVVKEGFASGTMSRDADGNLQVQGANSAAQGVLNSMYKNRKYAVAPYRSAPSTSGTGAPVPGKYSVNERVLYDKAAVDAERQAHLAAGPSAGAFDEYSAIDKHALRTIKRNATTPTDVVLGKTASPGYDVQRIEVTGDEERSKLPK